MAAEKFEVGAIVRVVNRTSGHCFPIGTLVRLTKKCEMNYIAEYLNGRDYWWVKDEELEALPKSTTERWVERTVGNNGGRHPVGTLGVVVHEHLDGDCMVQVGDEEPSLWMRCNFKEIPPPEPSPAVPPEAKPLDTQVDGSHYKDMKIQVVEFCHANGIPYMEGNVIKYICRWKLKNGLADLKKAKHYIELLMQMEEESAVAG